MKQQINLQKQRLNLTKFIALILTLALDLSLNSVLDYDLFNDQYRGTASSTSTGTQLLLGLAGLQIVVNISIFLILFLAMADTFLFRVGLLGLLLKKFRSVLLIHPVYITLTIATGAYRVNHFSSGNTLATLWKDQSFFALSSIHKIVAIVYYLMNLRAIVKLGDPIYFNKEAWIALVKQRRQADANVQVSRVPDRIA